MTDWKQKYENLAAAVRDDLRYNDCGHSPPDECCTCCALKVLAYEEKFNFKGEDDESC